MIGWYCDIGIYRDIPKNLSDIEFIDYNRPYPFYQCEESGITYSGNFINPNEAYDYLKSFLGSQVDALYCPTYVNKAISSSDKRKSIEVADLLIPSFSLGYPNLLEKCVNNDSVTFCVFFKTLKRLLTQSSDTYSGIGLFIVNDDNSLTSVNIDGSSNRGTQANGLFTVSSSYPVHLNMSLPNIIKNVQNPDMADPSNYLRNLRMTIYNSPRNNITYEIVFNATVIERPDRYTLFYTKLFENGSTPDFVGSPGPDNPYEPGGPSGPGGGNGAFDDDSDKIVDSLLPTISSANTGFTRIYNPSLSQVQALARYLWTDENVIQTIWNHIKQYFEDPMQAIIGFNLVPVPVPNGGTQNFALMYIDTGVEMTVAASQFVDVDCGTFELKEYYGSALDYAPNTKVSCFLPFIGTVSLNTDEVMGRTLQVKYRVDICSGSCVAKIAVDGNFIYQYSGHCAINIPISSADFSSYVSSAISVAQLAAGAIAAGAGGVMASTAVDATQQTNQVVTTTQITNTARNPATGRQITTGTMTRVETRESPNDQSSTQASFSGISPQNISNTVGQIMSSKPNINHSGSFSGNSGYLGVRRPFLIIERPNMCMPSNFQALNGFPSMITLELSSCKGFTRVQQVQLTGFYATNPEQAEILQLLKSGVIL